MNHRHHYIINHVFLMFFLLFGMGVMFSQVAVAQSAIIPDCALQETAEDVGARYCDDASDLVQLAINIGEFVFSIIGSVALIMFVYGGFMMILSFGKSENIQKGKEAMVAAIVGLIIAFSGYAIVQFIQQSFGVTSNFFIS